MSVRSLCPLLVAAVALAGCATLGRVADLARVDFFIDRVAGAELAGVGLDGVRRFEDLRVAEILRVADAVRRGRVPLRFTVHVGAENPAANAVALRLARLEWTVLLEDRETVSGVLRRDIVLAPGRATDIPVPVELDLLGFFREGGPDLARLALRAVGAGGRPASLKLRLRPTLSTPLGELRYPEPITVVDREI
jgi:hypothetical protein